jgi:hypothetical protein
MEQLQENLLSITGQTQQKCPKYTAFLACGMQGRVAFLQVVSKGVLLGSPE